MQLSFIYNLFESETRDKNFIVNILNVINNLKYYRVLVERRMGDVKEFTSEFNRLMYVNQKIGYCLYYMATLGYLHSKELREYEDKGQDWWYDKTLNKGFGGPSLTPSIQNLYDSIIKIESLSKRLISLNATKVESSPVSLKIVKFYFESMKDLKNEYSA